MAFVDTDTKKIYGAKEGTLTYFHEIGHLAFIKRSKGVKIQAKAELAQQMLLMFLAIFLIIPNIITRIFIFWFLVRWLAFYTYEEVWAWIYAFKRKRLEGGTQEI